MMQSKTDSPVDAAHVIVVALQPIQIQTHLTQTTTLVEGHQNRIHLMSFLPSGGQSESMSKSCSIIITVTVNSVCYCN